MPHQCTTCGHTFEDGSKEMLGGCPDCGGNTFQFHPPGTDPPEDPPADSGPPAREEPTGASAVGRAATRVRDFVSSDSSPDPDATLDSSAGDPEPAPGDLPDAPDERPARTAPSADEADEVDEADEAGGTDETEPTDAGPTDPAGDSAGARADAPEADDANDANDTSDANDAPGTDGVDVVETRSDGPSRTRDDRSSTESRPERPVDGARPTDRDRTADRDRRGDPSTPSAGPLDRSSPPDPNAPWPTEDDPSGSGGDADGSSPDDIIDADAREAERAIGDAEDADDRAGGPERHPDGSAPARESGSPAASSPAASGGAATDTSGTPDSGTDDGSSGATPEARDDDPADESGLAAAENAPEGTGQVVSEPSGDQPDLAELREQLNEQFESIKILEPGQYELNLMELYDREEYIIALQENGRYVIQVPENWMGDRPGDE